MQSKTYRILVYGLDVLVVLGIRVLEAAGGGPGMRGPVSQSFFPLACHDWEGESKVKSGNRGVVERKLMSERPCGLATNELHYVTISGHVPINQRRRETTASRSHTWPIAPSFPRYPADSFATSWLGTRLSSLTLRNSLPTNSISTYSQLHCLHTRT